MKMNENETKQLVQQVKEKKKVPPMFFVDKRQIQIDLYVIYDSLSGKIINVSIQDLGRHITGAVQGIEQIVYSFILTKPNYQQISTYRQMSMYWDNRANKTIVNPFKLRNYLILNHLKAWKGVTDEFGEPVNLVLDKDDTLTQASLELVYTVNSSIIDVLMTQFQNKAMLY